MEHHIEAFVAEKAVLEKNAPSLPAATVLDLVQGFGILPVTKSVKAQAKGGVAYKGLALAKPLADWAKRASTDGPVAYIEGHYPAASNHQGAVVWTQGAETLGPETDDSAWDPRENNEERPVNRALRELGLRVGEFDDEWDAAGLTRRYDTEDWVA